MMSDSHVKAERITTLFRVAALALFAVYLAVFPGSTALVALDAVPESGRWMGPALLLLQGAAAVCWLLGAYGRRGALAGLLVLLLGWGVEQLGATTGVPFGRYSYTAALQPQLLGTVPLPIIGAWLMAALGAWQLAQVARWPGGERFQPAMLLLAATLVLVLDLQIETVATQMNRFWVWRDSGPYYGIPVANFVAWWAVGLLMASTLEWTLGRLSAGRENQKDTGNARFTSLNRQSLFSILPALLYILSTVMFTVSNLARGYALAGLVGIVFLLVAAGVIGRGGLAAAAAAIAPRSPDRSPADRA
jgi:putative membrane protein